MEKIGYVAGLVLVIIILIDYFWNKRNRLL